MEAATAEKPAEKIKPVTFETSRPNFRVTVFPAHDALRDQNQRVITPADPGKHAQFDGFTFTTDDPEIIDHLRGIEEFGTSVWEEGAQPGEAKPTVAEQIRDITRAAVKGDALTIGAVIEVEKAKHNRKVVLLAAKEALQEIEAAE